jgi:hypothetical protein
MTAYVTEKQCEENRTARNGTRNRHEESARKISWGWLTLIVGVIAPLAYFAVSWAYAEGSVNKTQDVRIENLEKQLGKMDDKLDQILQRVSKGP